MNLKENDAKIIKNAGAVITHPFGGIMRSVMVAIYSLDADEVFVIGHHDCGMTRVDATTTLGNMIKKGIARHTLVTMQYSGIDIHGWLSGFKSVEDSVANSVDIIRNHPLMPISIPVHGLVIDPYTGRLDLVVDGYKEMPVLTGGMPLAQSEWLKSIPSFDEPTEDEARKVVGGGGGGGVGEEHPEESIMQMHERAIASVAVRARSISSLSEGGGGTSTSIDSVTTSVSSLAVTAATPPEAPLVAPAIARQMQRSSSSTSLSSSSLSSSSSSSTISSSLSQPFAHLGIELREQQKAVIASATGVESPNSQSIGSSTMSIGRAANRQRKPVVFSGAGMGIN
jgi:carbonic anhydrase